jgi:hypothetical protein
MAGVNSGAVRIIIFTGEWPLYCSCAQRLCCSKCVVTQSSTTAKARISKSWSQMSSLRVIPVSNNLSSFSFSPKYEAPPLPSPGCRSPQVLSSEHLLHFICNERQEKGNGRQSRRVVVVLFLPCMFLQSFSKDKKVAPSKKPKSVS